MKKLLLGLCFAILPLAGFAQSTISAECYPLDIKGESVSDISWYARTDNGWYIFWFCKDPLTSVYSPIYLYCIHGECNQAVWGTLQIAVGRAPTNTAKATEIDNVISATATNRPCDPEITNNTKYKLICQDVIAAIGKGKLKLPQIDPPPPPPALVYQVPKAASNASPTGTRPMYTVVNGAKGIVFPGVRVKEFATCDCSTKILDGSSTYCKVPETNHPELISLCVVKTIP